MLENVDEEIILKNDEHHVNIDLDKLIRQNDEKKLLFWLIYNVLSLLILINLNMLLQIYFDLIYLLTFGKYYYIIDD